MAGKSKKLSGVDPAYVSKLMAQLKRTHRKTVLFNSKELEMIDEYCRRFKVESRSALIRQAVMERILQNMDDNHPTLF